MVSVVSAQARPGIPSGPGTTSRDAIFLVASCSSASVTRSSCLHSVVVGALPQFSSEAVAEGGPGCPAQLSCRGNGVPMTLSGTTGSIFPVSGGRGAKVVACWSRSYTASPTDRIRPTLLVPSKTELLRS
jgi:hypothetical protein